MRFYNISGSDREIHAKFYKNLKEGTWKNADILLCGPEELKKQPGRNFRYLVCNMTNTQHIKTPIGAKMVSLKGEDLYWIRSTAEHTIYLMLSLVKRQNREQPCGEVLAGKSLGIIGYGRVGKQVEVVADALDMDVHVVDSPRLDDDYKTHVNFVLSSDFISIHASVGKIRKPIFGMKQLNLVKNGAYIINTARPVLVDETAILKHIDRLGGFASDFKVGPLLRLWPNVVTTDHTGGYTKEDMIRTSEICYDKLRRMVNANEKR